MTEREATGRRATAASDATAGPSGDATAGRPVVVVVGPPGAGKSTVGTLLSRRLGVPFTDADAEIEKRIGKSISEMFTDDGEPAFRALEREVVAELLGVGCGVLALGGGAVLAESTRALLRGHRVLALRVSLVDGLHRTGMSTARPLLMGVNPRATFRALLEARAPLYHEVATVEVDTSGHTPAQVVAAALARLGLAAVVADGPGDDAAETAAAAGPGPAPGAVGLPSPVFGRPAPP